MPASLLSTNLPPYPLTNIYITQVGENGDENINSVRLERILANLGRSGGWMHEEIQVKNVKLIQPFQNILDDEKRCM